MGGGGPVMAWSVLAGVSQPLMHDMALMQPEGDGCAAAQEGPRLQGCQSHSSSHLSVGEHQG